MDKNPKKRTLCAWGKIHSNSQIFGYGQKMFCLSHWPNFSDIFDLFLWQHVPIGQGWPGCLQVAWLFNHHAHRPQYLKTPQSWILFDRTWAHFSILFFQNLECCFGVLLYWFTTNQLLFPTLQYANHLGIGLYHLTCWPQ